MQRGFIKEFKENLKALKQEIKGAEIYNGEVKFKKYHGYSKEFVIKSDIHKKEFSIDTSINEKKLGIFTQVKGFTEEDVMTKVRKIELGMESHIKKYKFETPTTEVSAKNLEKFITVTKAKIIELTKKSKINNCPINKFKVKTYEGTDKIRRVPATIEGRRFLSNKELIDLAIKIKMENKNLDFTKYNFKVVFENLPIDLIEDYQYIDDSAELKIYYKKYTKELSKRSKLVILTEKNSLNSEKIFV